jgi:DNA-binding CsgD family transcriptional regulator
VGAPPDIRLFERSLHGMVLADDDRRLREVNHAACVIVQRPQEVLLRSRIDDVTAPVALPQIEATWRELLDQGALHGRWPLVTGDQRLVEIEYSSVARARRGLHLIVFVTRSMPAVEPDDTARAGAPLTEREAEVLKLLSLGYTGPEIADRLVVGVDTVRTHIRNLKRKLGARTLPHLVALGLSHQK